MEQLVLQTIAGVATHTLDDSGNATHTGTVTAASVVAPTAAIATLTTTRGVTSGTALEVGGLAYASTAASTAILGTQEAATAFDTTYTLPANTLQAGTKLHIRAQGIHTLTTGAETHSMALKLGTISLALQASINPTDNDIFSFDAYVICRTAGASGTVVGVSTGSFGANGSAASATYVLASTTIDTTAAHVISVTIDRQGTATDTDSARLDILSVEVVG